VFDFDGLLLCWGFFEGDLIAVFCSVSFCMLVLASSGLLSLLATISGLIWFLVSAAGDDDLLSAGFVGSASFALSRLVRKFFFEL
jgi:hypothetical protein